MGTKKMIKQIRKMKKNGTFNEFKQTLNGKEVETPFGTIKLISYPIFDNSQSK